MTTQEVTVTKRFVNVFDPKNQQHVTWLKWIHEEVQLVSANSNRSSRITSMITNNPMGVKITQTELLEWVHIHFVLAMKYCGAVFDKTAYIPQ